MVTAGLLALVLPLFQKNLQCEPPWSKARQDLDTIRQAISLHDFQNKPLSGASLQPLVGRYL